MVTNPRYPHWCRIIRKTASSPLIEEGGFTPIDEYDPLGGDSEGSSSSSSSSGEETEEAVIYEGECRCYDKNTVSDRGEVITSNRGLSIPMTMDEWSQKGVCPQEGDEVVVKRGLYSEYGRIVDKNPATASFAGTHIIWRYGRD